MIEVDLGSSQFITAEEIIFRKFYADIEVTAPPAVADDNPSVDPPVDDPIQTEETPYIVVGTVNLDRFEFKDGYLLTYNLYNFGADDVMLIDGAHFGIGSVTLREAEDADVDAGNVVYDQDTGDVFVNGQQLANITNLGSDSPLTLTADNFIIV